MLKRNTRLIVQKWCWISWIKWLVFLLGIITWMFHSNPLPEGSSLILGRHGSNSRPRFSTLRLTSPLRIQQVQLCHPSRAWFKMRRFRNYAFLRIHFTLKLRLIYWCILQNFVFAHIFMKRDSLRSHFVYGFEYGLGFSNLIFVHLL